MEDFKKRYTLQERREEAARIKKKFPDRIPVIVERTNGSNIVNIDKRKYLVPKDLTVGQFIYVIRKRVKLSPEEAIFIFINNTLPASGALLSQIYKENKDEDEFLYVKYSGESVFG